MKNSKKDRTAASERKQKQPEPVQAPKPVVVQAVALSDIESDLIRRGTGRASRYGIFIEAAIGAERGTAVKVDPAAIGGIPGDPMALAAAKASITQTLRRRELRNRHDGAVLRVRSTRAGELFITIE